MLKNINLTILLAAISTFTAANPLGPDDWVNGVNMPWEHCGNDWGVNYKHSNFNKHLRKYANNGANVYRQFIHFDGNKNLNLWDDNNDFKRIAEDSQFLKDAIDNLRLAKSKKIQVILSMFSYECVDFWMCSRMISNTQSTSAYIQNGLLPLLDEINYQGLQDQVYAFEILNEPEWMVNPDSTHTLHKLPLSQVQTFISSCNEMINRKGFRTTVGSASLEWSCKSGSWCVGDWWANTGISFRTVHYVTWMALGGKQYDPFSTKPSDWGFNETERVLIGSSPGINNLLTVRHNSISIKYQFALAKENGWLGIVSWSDLANDGEGYFNIIKTGLACNSDWTKCPVPSTSFIQEVQEDASFVQ